MKYKITVNGTLMFEKITALKAMNQLCNIMKSRMPGEVYEVKVYALHGESTWILENEFIAR